MRLRAVYLSQLVFLIAAHATLAASLQKQPLQAELRKLTEGFDGRVGICIQDQSGSACVNGDQRFAMQSVMKLLVATAVMDAVDHRGWRLDTAILVRRQDLSLYVQPIAKLVTAKGYRTTIGDLVRRAVVDSDSAATDILVAKLGGPAAVQQFLNRNHIAGVRFDRNERDLQTEIVGIRWHPEFVDADVLDRAIAAVPEAIRDRFFREYQVDPRDTATPDGMAYLLFKLAAGKLLTPPSTAYLLDVMTQTVTFPDRLKAGIPTGWKIAHKTGTSSTWKGVTAGTNDVGVLVAPDGGKFSIAVFLGDSRESSEKRAALMARVAALAATHYH